MLCTEPVCIATVAESRTQLVGQILSFVSQWHIGLNTTIGTCDVLSGPSYRISLLPLQHLTTLRRVTRFVKSLAECAADRHTHACERSAVCRSQSGRGN